jgi:hypothetical protein
MRTKASDARADAYGPTAARAANKARRITRKDAERQTISKFVKLGQDESAAGAIRMARRNGVFQESLRHALVRRIDGRFDRTHMLASYKGLIFCWRCAAYTTGLSCRLLAHACRRKVDERGSVLKSIAAERKPPFLRRWPDDGDEVQTDPERQRPVEPKGVQSPPQASPASASSAGEGSGRSERAYAPRPGVVSLGQHEQVPPEPAGNQRFEALLRRIKAKELGHSARGNGEQ